MSHVTTFNMSAALDLGYYTKKVLDLGFPRARALSNRTTNVFTLPPFLNTTLSPKNVITKCCSVFGENNLGAPFLLGGIILVCGTLL
jgi:hypothetical protein